MTNGMCAGEPAVADSHVGCLQSCEYFGQLGDGGGAVSIHKNYNIPLRGHDTGSHRCAFALIFLMFDKFEVGQVSRCCWLLFWVWLHRSGLKCTHDGAGGIATAIIDDNDFSEKLGVLSAEGCD